LTETAARAGRIEKRNKPSQERDCAAAEDSEPKDKRYHHFAWISIESSGSSDPGDSEEKKSSVELCSHHFVK